MHVEMLCVSYKWRLVIATKRDITFFNNNKILGFCKSGSAKWRKPRTLLHDNSLEISQTKNPLHNNCILLTHLQIDACCDIVHCVFSDISVNWRTTIYLSLLRLRVATR